MSISESKGLDVDGAWETRRQPDAVRVAALANAVELVAGMGAYHTVDYQDVAATAIYTLDLARTFEAYLTGEEANDPS